MNQANNTKLKNSVIQVQAFVAKMNRMDARNNLYIKNLPMNFTEPDLTKKISDLMNRFGPIASSVVKFEKNLGRPFAFICFEDHSSAENAYNSLQNTDPFNIGMVIQFF